MLNALAEQARQQADRRRIVEAERAPRAARGHAADADHGGAHARPAASSGGREYLDAYDTAAGQLFLGVILGYAVLLVRVQRLAPLPAPEPLPHGHRRGRCLPIGGSAVSPIGAIVLCSFVLVAGVWLALSGWQRPRPRLDDAMAHLRRRPDDCDRVARPTFASGFRRPGPRILTQTGVGAPLPTVARLGEAARAADWLAGRPSWDQTLHLVGTTRPTSTSAFSCSHSLAAFVVPSAACSACCNSTGVVSISWFVPAAISVAGGAWSHRS